MLSFPVVGSRVNKMILHPLGPSIDISPLFLFLFCDLPAGPRVQSMTLRILGARVHYNSIPRRAGLSVGQSCVAPHFS